MLPINEIHKSITVFLVLMVFVTMANSLASVRVSHAFPGPVVAGTVCQESSTASSVPVKDDFKPPKNSFVDYDIFFSCVAFKPMNRPVAAAYTADTGSRAISGAVPEILIPPKI